MVTAGKANAKEGPKEINFSWEGKNKAGKVVRGDIRAASESVANIPRSTAKVVSARA